MIDEEGAYFVVFRDGIGHGIAHAAKTLPLSGELPHSRVSYFFRCFCLAMCNRISAYHQVLSIVDAPGAAKIGSSVLEEMLD